MATLNEVLEAAETLKEARERKRMVDSKLDEVNAQRTRLQAEKVAADQNVIDAKTDLKAKAATLA